MLFRSYDGPGKVSTVAFNMRTLASRYNKPVMICEMGHSSHDRTGTYEDVKSIVQAHKNLPRNAGLGVFYWEPEAPEDTTTKHYGLGAVTPARNKLEQFTSAIDAYLQDSTSSSQVSNPNLTNGLNGGKSPRTRTTTLSTHCTRRALDSPSGGRHRIKPPSGRRLQRFPMAPIP